MENNKYRRLEPEEQFSRIIALRDFDGVKKGDIGGILSKDAKLSSEGNCWIYDNARVTGHAQVLGDAKIYDTARVVGAAKIMDDAVIKESAIIKDCAVISQSACVAGHACVSDYAHISGNALVNGRACICNDVIVGDGAHITGHAKIHDSAIVSRDMLVTGYADICGDAHYFPHNEICGKIKIDGDDPIKNVIITRYPKNVEFIKQIKEHSNLHVLSDGSSVVAYKKISNGYDLDTLNKNHKRGIYFYSADDLEEVTKVGEKIICVLIKMEDVLKLNRGAIMASKAERRFLGDTL